MANARGRIGNTHDRDGIAMSRDQNRRCVELFILSTHTALHATLIGDIASTVGYSLPLPAER